MGLFLALATPPGLNVTGAVGRAVGAALRALFGAGAAFVPAIPLYWAIALFGHFERTTSRATILLAGLAAVRSASASSASTRTLVRAASGRGRTTRPRGSASWGGMFAYYLRFGPVGEDLLALGAFSA